MANAGRRNLIVVVLESDLGNTGFVMGTIHSCERDKRILKPEHIIKKRYEWQNRIPPAKVVFERDEKEIC